MTAAAVDAVAFADPDLCPACLDSVGKLCHRHAVGVLPQLAVNVGWLRLIGDARIEQKRLQTLKPTKKPRVSEPRAGWLERRKAARKAARSKRRGYFGLARKIAGLNTAPTP